MRVHLRAKTSEVREVTVRKVKKIASKYGHNVEFVPYVDPPTCGPCRDAAHMGKPTLDVFPRCGLGSGSYRCTNCVRRSQGGAKGFWDNGCNMHDPLSTIPNQKGNGRYGNLHVRDDDTSDEEEEGDQLISTAGIIGLDPSKPKPGTAADHSTEEAAFLNDDLDLDASTRPAGQSAAARSYL